MTEWIPWLMYGLGLVTGLIVGWMAGVLQCIAAVSRAYSRDASL